MMITSHKLPTTPITMQQVTFHCNMYKVDYSLLISNTGPSEAPPSKRSRSQRDQHPVIDLTADQQPPLLMRSCADLRDPPLPRRERIEALRGLFARLDLTREVIENQGRNSIHLKACLKGKNITKILTKVVYILTILGKSPI